MSPSELDTKAPSVPPHPFKVGDKVRLKRPDITGRMAAGTVRSVNDYYLVFETPFGDYQAYVEGVQHVEGANEVKPAPTCTCRNEYETCSVCTEPKTVAPGIAAWLKNSKGEKFEVPKPDDEQIKELGALAKHLPINDAVNHPNHYTAGTLETIDAIEAMVGQVGWSPATGYRLGNVLKYLWRHAHKGGLESLKKARWYLDREIAAVEKAQEKKP